MNRLPRFQWIGAAMAVAYWILESLIHTYVFGSGTFASTLFGGHDSNELWMRLLISAMFVAFGWIAERAVRGERRLKEDALRLNALLSFVHRVRESVQEKTNRGGGKVITDPPAASNRLVAASRGVPLVVPVGQNLAPNEDVIGLLTRTLLDLSWFLDERFKELYALLQLTNEINMGLLLDEILEKAYESLRAVIPFNRLSVALLEDDGRVVRARWAQTESATMMLRRGYSAPMKGSSLQGIIASGEPRIINDLALYLGAHPGSDSTRLMVNEGIRSSLTCPLISMGKPIGFIFFSSRTVGTYENVHVDIFRLIAGHLSIVVEKSNLYQLVLHEKEKSESLLLNVMPARIAERLRTGETPVAEQFPEACVLFADVVGFTIVAGRFTADEIIRVLQELFVLFDGLCVKYGIEKIKTIGDAYLAFSTPSCPAGERHVQACAEFALAMLRTVGTIRYPDGTSLNVRIGMNLGPIVAGVIGQKKFFYDIWGDTVNVASRMESTGEAGRIHMTGALRARLQDDFLVETRGDREIKGKGTMETYFLKGKMEPPVSPAPQA